MKKSELTQLTQIIEYLVAREVRKQLPGIIQEAFGNTSNKPIIKESSPVKEEVVQEEQVDFRASLKELFDGTPVIKPASENKQEPKHYTKNPVYNQILNETIGDLRSRERLVGAAAFQGGYSPGLNLVPGFNPEAAMPMMEEEIGSFSKNMPTMDRIPVSNPPILTEGQVSNHAPMNTIPAGTSVLDYKNQLPTTPAVKTALTRNYSEMMKLIDKKKGKV